MKRAVAFLLPALGLAWTPVAGAQEQAAHEHVRQGLAYVTAGDTILAFSEFEKAIDVFPALADAHYHVGRLYTNRASSVETDFRDRLRAERALLEALRLSPAEPRYLLELARLRLKQHMRVDAERLFGRALNEAEKVGDPEVLAEVRFHLGYIQELKYQALQHRRLNPLFRGPPVAELNRLTDVNITRYTNRYLNDAPAVERSGELAKQLMIEHYRAALRHDPSHVAASVRLMGQLLDDRRLGEYLALGRRLRRAHPEHPEPYLYLGLGLHMAGQEERAAEAFESALARLPDRERKAVESLATVMRRKAAEEYLDLSDAERQEYHTRYWRLLDPLYLTESNERRLEHLSRVAYADLRFSAPAVGRRGWEADQGVIYIRYGPPQQIAAFGPLTSDRGNPYAVGRRSILWTYGKEGPVFIFRQMPGYLDARFAGDFKFLAEDYRYVQPSKYENIPSIPELLDLPVQLARFRGGTPQEVAVEIHAKLPLERLARDLDLETGELETGLFVLNNEGETIVRQLGLEVVSYVESPDLNEYRSWRVVMPPGGAYVAAVEARDDVTWRAAAARDTFTAEAFGEDSLSVSDILVADFVRPLREDARVRSDYQVMPNAALQFRSGEPVHIYYEIYGLNRDAEGFAAYDVSLQVRVKRLERGGGLAALLGTLADAWGFSIVGDDRLELRYSRQVEMDGRDRVAEYLSLDPQEVPAGEYEIRLRIWDRIEQRMARRLRSFTVVAE